MTTHVVCLEIFCGHGANASPWNLRPLQNVQVRQLAVTDATGISDPLPAPIVPLSCNTLQSNAPISPAAAPVAEFIGHAQNDQAAPVALACHSVPVPDAELHWAVDGAFAGNGNGFPIRQVFAPPESRNAPSLVADFAGDALTGVQGGGAVTTMSGVLQYTYQRENPYQGLAHLVEFEDDPPDSANTGEDVVRRVTQALQYPAGGSQVELGIDSTGQTLVVKDCNFAGLAPEATVYVDPGDFPGNNPEQIPQSVTNNTAGSFRFHPSVFVRRSNYIRSVHRRFRDDEDIATQLVNMPIRIRVVDQDPTASNWLIAVDGVFQIVRLDHGGVDLRRPRDIWNELWVPLINANASVADAPVLEVLPFQTNAVGPGASQLRLRFLEYARCLPLAGTDGTQTDAAN